MLNNFGKTITTLQEDFERLGLLKTPLAGESWLLNESAEEDGDSTTTVSAELEESENVDFGEGFSLSEELDDYLAEEEDGENEGDALIEESGYSEEVDSLLEGLGIQKTKRMSASDRAKSRLARRKKKTVINRKRRLRSKKSSFKIRKKRVDALKKGRSAGPRRRFVLKQSMGESFSLLEDLEAMNMEASGDIYESLEHAFKSAESLAKTLSRKFSVIEETMEHLEEGVDFRKQNAMMLGIEEPSTENPDQEYGEEGGENFKKGGKTGDATDTVKDAPKGNVKSKDEQPHHKTPKGNIKFEDIELNEEDLEESIDMGFHRTLLKDHGLSKAEAAKVFQHALNNLSKHYKEKPEVIMAYLNGKAGAKMAAHLDKDDQDVKSIIKGLEDLYKKPEVQKGISFAKKHHAESLTVSDDMVNVRLEAQELMQNLRQHAVSPKEAGNILRDMVQYLGGAMKTYMDMAQDMGKLSYAGKDAPKGQKEKPDQDDSVDKKYVGKEDGPKHMAESLTEAIKRVPVKNLKDMKKVSKLIDGIGPEMDKAHKAVRVQESRVSDLMHSIANSVREIRLWLEDNYTLDEEKFESKSKGFTSAALKLQSACNKLDSRASGLGQSVGAPSVSRGKMGIHEVQKDISGKLSKLISEFNKALQDFEVAHKKEG